MVVVTDRRRARALLILAGAALVAVALAVTTLLVAKDTTPTRDVRSAVVSPDGQYRATLYSRKRAFTFADRVEVTLRRVGAGGEVSLGCVVTENDPVIELTFEPGDTVLTVDVGGMTQRIRYDPRTLYPSELIGPC